LNLKESNVSFFNLSTVEEHSGHINLVVLSFNQSKYTELILNSFVFAESMELALVSYLIGQYLAFFRVEVGLSSFSHKKVYVNDLYDVGITNVKAAVTYSKVLDYKKCKEML
jgi:hypothetical protein